MAEVDMSEALIDVIIPVYNDMKYLKPTVDSVLAQTFSDFVITRQIFATVWRFWTTESELYIMKKT